MAREPDPYDMLWCPGCGNVARKDWAKHQAEYHSNQELARRFELR